SSEIYGAELQGRYHVTDELIVNGGVAYTHARYDSFKNAPFYSYCDPSVPAFGDMGCGISGAGALTQTTGDASGLRMQRAPDWTANLGVSYDTPLGGGALTLSGNYYYSSSFYFDPSQQFKQDAYNVVALRAQWVDPSQRYTFAIYGDNVTDEDYQ